MIPRLPLSVLLVVLFLGVAAPAMADLVGAETLLAESAAWDGRTVEVEGELVGDYGWRRDGTVWVQLNDDSYARQALVDGGPLTGPNVGIGIRMDRELATPLGPIGRYRTEGPLVRVSGTWRHHDPSRGGESYLDVTSLTVVAPGRSLVEGPDWWALIGGSVLIAVSLGLEWQRRVRAGRSLT